MTKFITFPFSLSLSPCIIIYFCMFSVYFSIFVFFSLYFVCLSVSLYVGMSLSNYFSLYACLICLSVLSLSLCKSNSMFVCLLICFYDSLCV